MPTAANDVQTSNSASSWMSQAEQSEEQLQQLLLAKLAQVPADATKISGPRNTSDLSYLIWQKVKQKVGVDFE